MLLRLRRMSQLRPQVITLVLEMACVVEIDGVDLSGMCGYNATLKAGPWAGGHVELRFGFSSFDNGSAALDIASAAAVATPFASPFAFLRGKSPSCVQKIRHSANPNRHAGVSSGFTIGFQSVSFGLIRQTFAAVALQRCCRCGASGSIRFGDRRSNWILAGIN